jgi:hypothetical protein
VDAINDSDYIPSTFEDWPRAISENEPKPGAGLQTASGTYQQRTSLGPQLQAPSPSQLQPTASTPTIATAARLARQVRATAPKAKIPLDRDNQDNVSIVRLEK